MIRVILYSVFTLCLIAVVYVMIYQFLFRYDESCSKLKVLNLEKAIDDFYLSEEDYIENMTKYVYPKLEKYRKSESFMNDGHTIVYESYLLEEPKATIIMIHGNCEKKEKYQEAIYYFLNMNYQVYIFDQYGHGESTRSPSDRNLVDVDHYAVYVNDLRYLIEEIVIKEVKMTLIVLFGHSMGGCIAALLAEQYPTLIDGLILSSPMFQVDTAGIWEGFAYPYIKLGCLLGKKTDYLVGEPYRQELEQEITSTHLLTNSQKRGSFMYQQRFTSSTSPTFGSSWQRVRASIDAIHQALKKENIAFIDAPILLFQAEEDRAVLPYGQYSFANSAHEIDFYLIENAQHELYIEKDEIIQSYFNQMKEFIETKILK